MNTQLQRKIDSSISMLQKAERTALRYQSYGFNVAFSGGKDSQVIVKLAELAGVKHRVVHNFTTMDAPANIRFIRENYPQCVIRKPKESFWQLCRRHKMLPTMMVRFCCSELKEKSDPNSVTITGVRRAESYRRSDRQESGGRTPSAGVRAFFRLRSALGAFKAPRRGTMPPPR